MNPVRAAIGVFLLALGWAGCGQEWQPIPGSTTRVGYPETKEGTELDLFIFTNPSDCVGARVSEDNLDACLPHIDRKAGEVSLAYQFQLDGFPYPMPKFKEHLQVFHLGARVEDGQRGSAIEVFPYDPVPVAQLFVLLIDGSSSMSEHNRIQKVRQALLMEEVIDAFFPPKTRAKTGVLLLQFTSGKPTLVNTGRPPNSNDPLPILNNPKEYKKAVRQLQVRSGYTHLYDAISFGTGELMSHPSIEQAINIDEMGVTVLALTDGFNNVSSRDVCADNAKRLETLLAHIEKVRHGEDINPRSRPTIFTVGLGRPLRPLFKLGELTDNKVNPRDLCGKKWAKTKIDGDLERRGIDNASLALIADRGGGVSHIKRDRDGLGQAFADAAAKRFNWFQLKYRIPSFYLRRSFTSRFRLVSYATAEASVDLAPSAWFDAPPGKRAEDNWTRPQSYLHTFTVLMPLLGLLVACSFVGAVAFNTRRTIIGRLRPPREVPQNTQPPPAPNPPPGNQ